MKSGTVSERAYAAAESFGRVVVEVEAGEGSAGIRPGKTVALIGAFLLSLGLWAAIWAAVASLW